MGKKISPIIPAVIAGLTVLLLSGPRAGVKRKTKPVTLPDDLDQYLAESEAQYPDLVPGTQKTILWANSDKNKTPYAIVYLHGFSATRQETAPLCELIATQLGANLYYTRLAGHGRGSEAMAEPCANDWLNDTIEALEIGRRLGDKVIVIGTSTGGTLAAWLAQQPKTSDVLAYVLMSPNFAPRDSRAEIMLLPWAVKFVPLLFGPRYTWTPRNELHARYWSPDYPSRALVTMMGLVDFVRKSNLESITSPTLVIYSPHDTVVNPQAVEHIFEKIGSSAKELYPVLHSTNPESHALAGDILAPADTPAMVEVIMTFLTKFMHEKQPG